MTCKNGKLGPTQPHAHKHTHAQRGRGTLMWGLKFARKLEIIMKRTDEIIMKRTDEQEETGSSVPGKKDAQARATK